MIYFIIYLFLEVLISVNISSEIGGLATFFEIVATALLGVSILVNFRETLMENLQSFSVARIDFNEFQRLNLFTLLGAFLLIIPGFFTDMLGVLLQFSAVSSMIVNRYGVKSQENNCSFYEQQNNIKKDSDVIDVEIISDDSTLK